MSKSSVDPIALFEKEKTETVISYKKDLTWQELSVQWLARAFQQKYMYNFTCLGRPIIQLPADMVAFQEIVWSVKPDLIVEAGIAHGGSLIMSASMLALLEYGDAAQQGTVLDPKKPKRRVLGIDIDIRAHNRAAIEAHPLAGRIDMIQGSSVSKETIEQVRKYAAGFKRVLLCLDSNHTHEHVLAELNAYAPLVGKGSYCIVFDTIVEDMPKDAFPDRPWKPGDSPKTAVREYLNRIGSEKTLGSDGQPLRFEIDKAIEDKLLLSLAPGGYLKRI